MKSRVITKEAQLAVKMAELREMQSARIVTSTKVVTAFDSAMEANNFMILFDNSVIVIPSQMLQLIRAEKFDIAQRFLDTKLYQGTQGGNFAGESPLSEIMSRLVPSVADASNPNDEANVNIGQMIVLIKLFRGFVKTDDINVFGSGLKTPIQVLEVVLEKFYNKTEQRFETPGHFVVISDEVVSLLKAAFLDILRPDKAIDLSMLGENLGVYVNSNFPGPWIAESDRKGGVELSLNPVEISLIYKNLRADNFTLLENGCVLSEKELGHILLCDTDLVRSVIAFARGQGVYFSTMILEYAKQHGGNAWSLVEALMIKGHHELYPYANEVITHTQSMSNKLLGLILDHPAIGRIELSAEGEYNCQDDEALKELLLSGRVVFKALQENASSNQLAEIYRCYYYARKIIIGEEDLGMRDVEVAAALTSADSVIYFRNAVEYFLDQHADYGSFRSFVRSINKVLSQLDDGSDSSRITEAEIADLSQAAQDAASPRAFVGRYIAEANRLINEADYLASQLFGEPAGCPEEKYSEEQALQPARIEPKTKGKYIIKLFESSNSNEELARIFYQNRELFESVKELQTYGVFNTRISNWMETHIESLELLFQIVDLKLNIEQPEAELGEADIGQIIEGVMMQISSQEDAMGVDGLDLITIGEASFLAITADSL